MPKSRKRHHSERSEPDKSEPGTSKPDTTKPGTSKPDTSKPDTYSEIYSGVYTHSVTNVFDNGIRPFTRVELNKGLEKNCKEYVDSDFFKKLKQIDKILNSNASNLDSKGNFQLDNQGQCTDNQGQCLANLQIQLNRMGTRNGSTTAASILVPYNEEIMPAVLQHGLKKSFETANQYLYKKLKESDANKQKSTKKKKR